MIEKNLTFTDDAWVKIKNGVQQLNRAVACTLGPNGKTVILEDAQGRPHVTKDGITVAVSIALDAPALDAQAGRWRTCSSALDLGNLKVICGRIQIY